MDPHYSGPKPAYRTLAAQLPIHLSPPPGQLVVQTMSATDLCGPLLQPLLPPPLPMWNQWASQPVRQNFQKLQLWKKTLGSVTRRTMW